MTTTTKLDDTGKLILRLAVAGIVLMHGWAKLRGGIGFVEQQVLAAGLPQIVAYGVYAGEVIAPVLIIAGMLTRPAALIMAFDVAMAVFLARWGDIGKVNPGGAWAIEAEMLIICGALAIACLGAGSFALGRSKQWN